MPNLLVVTDENHLIEAIEEAHAIQHLKQIRQKLLGEETLK
jgi:hypothetical protein